jgi:hypothetical protein
MIAMTSDGRQSRENRERKEAIFTWREHRAGTDVHSEPTRSQEREVRRTRKQTFMPCSDNYPIDVSLF